MFCVCVFSLVVVGEIILFYYFFYFTVFKGADRNAEYDVLCQRDS